MSIPASLWAKSLPIPANEKAVLREMADIVRKAVNQCPGPVRWLTERRWLDGSQAEPRRSAPTTTQIRSGMEWFETAIRDGKSVSFAWRILNLRYQPLEREAVRARYRDLLDQHDF